MIHLCPHCKNEIDVQPPAPAFLTVDDGKNFMQEVAKLFGIDPVDFFHKYGNRPAKNSGEVSMSEIRKAVAYRIRTETETTLVVVGAIIGVDYSSVIAAVKKAKKQLKEKRIKDGRFLNVYERIKSIPLVKVDTETITA